MARKNLIMNNSREYAIYQMTLFSDYAELKELRAPMGVSSRNGLLTYVKTLRQS